MAHEAHERALAAAKQREEEDATRARQARDRANLRRALFTVFNPREGDEDQELRDTLADAIDTATWHDAYTNAGSHHYRLTLDGMTLRAAGHENASPALIAIDSCRECGKEHTSGYCRDLISLGNAVASTAKQALECAARDSAEPEPTPEPPFKPVPSLYSAEVFGKAQRLVVAGLFGGYHQEDEPGDIFAAIAVVLANALAERG